MVKAKQVFEMDKLNEVNTRDINSVTMLPALRETIRMFNSSSTNLTSEYLSVSVYEITKYLYILENYGIDAVDEMISDIAECLLRIWGKNSFIAHIMDDRFIIITRYAEVSSVHEITDLLESEHSLLFKEFKKLSSAKGKAYYVDIDYGYIVAEPGWNESFESYLRMANSEMLMNHLQRDLKSSNNSKTVLWKHQEVFNLLIEKNLFLYHFQPIIDSQNGNIFGYEALMRTAPMINMRPLEVIDIASNLGKLYEIEKATMSNVMEYVSQNIALFEEKKIFINSIPAYMLKIEDWNILVEKYGYLMHKLVVEMTEQTEIDDENLNRFRNRLKEYNISLAIDDYGTGFSNLSNLIRYNPDYVKIDRSLVKDIHEKPKVQKLVSGIIEFIHENGYSALAEGVETYEELKTMIGLEVDYVQGYYIARPEPELLKEIETKLRDEIISLNILRSEYAVKVYNPSENEIINLLDLATKHYNSILIDKENIVIEGVKGIAVNCSIAVKDGVKANITLKDVNITTEKEIPLIDIGLDCDVTLNIEGENEIINRGIRVPQGSQLHLGGNGNLHIHCEMVNSFAIGGDNDSTYGSIYIDHLFKMMIDVSGENCIGIGGGKNTSDSKIHIINSDIRMECAGGNAVGIGSFDGDTNITIQNSDIELNMSCANAVAIGALTGNAQLTLDEFNLNIVECGNNLCGVGVLNNGEGGIKISNGSIECNMRGRSIVCLGSDNGGLNSEIEKANTTFYCEGNSVVGIGDMNGKGNLRICDANLNMTILAKDILDIGSKNGCLDVVDCKRNIRMNE